MSTALNTKSFLVAAAVLVGACAADSGTTPPPGGNGGRAGNAGNAGKGGLGGVGSGGFVGVGSGGTSSGNGGAGSGAAGWGGLNSGSGGTVSGSGGSNPATGGTGGATNGGGYRRSATWHGYAWASASPGSTINPTSFATVAPEQPLCASGTLGKSYSDVGIVGVNLKQEEGSTTLESVTPSGDGITINVTNTGGSPLRLQIQAADGSTNENHRWCAPITSADTFVPWSAFKTNCWPGGVSVPYDGEAITAAMVLVPGDEAQAVGFDFCVNTLEEHGVSSGTGGSGSGGSGSGGSGSGGTAGTGGTASTNDGYWISDDWHGFAWTATDSTSGTTITPKSFAGVAENGPYCASGTIKGATTAVAMVGVNLNQERAANAESLTVVPSKDGITVNVTNSGGTPLRLQIQAPGGSTDESKRWCAAISGSGGFIPWSGFNTRCWNNAGTAYNGTTALESALVLVPGGASDRSFNFCLNSLTETESGDGGNGGNAGSSGTGSGPGSPSGTLSGKSDWFRVTRDSRQYIVQNNVWGSSASQALTYNGVSFEITEQTGSNGTGGQPVSYPSVFIGANHPASERFTTGSNLPKLVSSIASADTSWTHNATGSISGEYNAAYDVWFSTGSSGDSGNPSGGYLMVWLYDPPNAQPRGELRQSSASVSGISGYFDVWIDDKVSPPCISYVRKPATTSMTFDLNKFIDDAETRGTIKSNWYLTNVFAGFEIWSGGVGLETTDFYAIVN
jgi:hypothetical protein